MPEVTGFESTSVLCFICKGGKGGAAAHALCYLLGMWHRTRVRDATFLNYSFPCLVLENFFRGLMNCWRTSLLCYKRGVHDHGGHSGWPATQKAGFTFPGVVHSSLVTHTCYRLLLYERGWNLWILLMVWAQISFALRLLQWEQLFLEIWLKYTY